MTPSPMYERVVNWLASILIVGLWAGCAWVITKLTSFTFEQAFLLVLALTLAERLPAKKGPVYDRP